MLFLLKDNGTISPTTNVEKWAEQASSEIKRDKVGRYTVITRFMGVHLSIDPPKPLMFITMVFSNYDMIDLIISNTQDEAVATHETSKQSCSVYLNIFKGTR